jgi:hypothetical protein
LTLNFLVKIAGPNSSDDTSGMNRLICHSKQLFRGPSERREIDLLDPDQHPTKHHQPTGGKCTPEIPPLNLAIIMLHLLTVLSFQKCR